MTKKKTMLAVLLSIAMSLLLCLGFIFPINATSVQAESITVVTLGTGRWATDLNNGTAQVSFNNCTTSIGTKVGEYTGVVYNSDNEEVIVTLSWSGETFVIAGLNSNDTSFTLYSETQFLRANGDIYQFAKNYQVTYTLDSGAITITELLEPITVKLDTGAGYWATDNGYTTGSGNPNTVKFTGVTVENAPTTQTRYNYTYNGAILSLDVYADGTTVVFNIRGDFSELIIMKDYKFVQQNGTQELYLDKDYKITWTYGSASITAIEYVEEPEVASAVVTLGTGRWATDLNDGTAQITFDNCTTSTGTKAGEYTGIVYVNGTEKEVTLLWSGETFVVRELNSTDTSFVILTETQFLRANGDVYQFAKDYKVTYELGTSNITIADYVAPVAAEVTLGASGWHGIPATGVAQLSFENSSYSGALTTSDYMGIVYDMNDNEYEATVFWSDLSKNTIRFKVSDSITSFIVKTDSVFTTENGDTITFDKDYLCSYVAGGTTSVIEYIAREPITVTIGAGRWATTSSCTLSFNQAVWGSSNDAQYSGEIYTEAGVAYKVIFTLTTSETDSNLVATLENTNLVSFIIKAETKFISDCGNEMSFDKDYIVTCNWDGAPSVVEKKDPVVVTLGVGRWATNNGDGTAQLSFNECTTSTGIKEGEYVGIVYTLERGEKEVTLRWNGEVFAIVGLDVNTTAFVILSENKFVRANGEIYLFDKNYRVTYQLDSSEIELKTKCVFPTDHSYGEELTQAATCTEDGKVYQVCSVCQEEKMIKTIAASHSFGDVLTKEATCASKGYTYQVCSVCQEEEKLSTLDELAHTPSDWIEEKAATETENGSKYKECTECGTKLETKVIPATGSNSSSDDATSDGPDSSNNDSTGSEVNSSSNGGNTDSEVTSSSNDASSGCFGSVRGLCGGVAITGFAIVALLKKKKEN